jgi:hypothetical protein
MRPSWPHFCQAKKKSNAVSSYRVRVFEGIGNEIYAEMRAQSSGAHGGGDYEHIANNSGSCGEMDSFE